MGQTCTRVVFCIPPSQPPSQGTTDRDFLLPRSRNSQNNPAQNNSLDVPFPSAAQDGRQHSSNAETLNEDGVKNVKGSGHAVMAGAIDVTENQMSTTHFNELESVKTVISRGSWGSSRIPEDSSTDSIIFVILGAHSQQAIKQLFPSLLRLYETGLIDQKRSQFVAMGLEDSNDSKFQEFCKEQLPGSSKKSEFASKLKYIRGDCCKPDELRKIPTNSTERTLFFLTLPSSIPHPVVMKAIDESPNTTSWTRVVLMGNDSRTYGTSSPTPFCISEDRIFRIDPFAGSDAVRRIVALRFGNRVLEPTWNRNHVKAILFDFSLDCSVSKNYQVETLLRDILVDHVLGLVALVAMERPASRFGDDVRDAKAAVLSAIQVARTDKMVLGRYTNGITGGNKSPTCITFATLCLDIDTNRWRGVPFICRVGSHMDRTKSEVRVLFRTAAGADALWRDQGIALRDNELSIRVVPSENSVLDLVSNLPGLDTQLKNQQSTLDFLSQPAPFVPEPIERLIYDAMRGRRANFVRKDCLFEAHRILQPLFQNQAPNEIHDYPEASRTGPEASDELIAKQVLAEHSRHHQFMICPWTKEGLVRDDVWNHAVDFSVEREMMLTLRVSFDQMRLLLRAFSLEMEKGIDARTRQVEGRPTIKMLETYVTKLPNGTEEGEFFGLDLGGTNFRVVKFILVKGQPARKVSEDHFKVPDECKTGTAQQLFDFLADCIAKVQQKDENAVYGFTFSFPTKQETLASGRLITWTKSWTTSGVVSNEVSGLLHDALERRNVKGTIVALINDTVGTLAAKARDDPLVRVGVILGTGTNAAFLDPITKSVINTEWGGFGSFDTIPELPFNKMDRAIDKESPNPGEQWFEKMISGYYLGEVARRWMMALYDAGELWRSTTLLEQSPPVKMSMGIDTMYLSEIELDLSDGLEMIREIEETHFGVKGSTLQDRILVRTVCRVAAERAARLTACAIAAVVNRINLPGTVVAIDGSLFESHASFKQRLIRALDMLGCQCPLVLSKDGSGLGAALIASAAVHT